jgi:hypothetical protein
MVGPDGLAPSTKFAIDFYQNFIFSDTHWDYRHYDFTNWKEDVAKVSAMLDATSTDLSEFKKLDGKIIFWHGWSDHLITALGTVDYYDELTGADPDADEYSRLYMLRVCTTVVVEPARARQIGSKRFAPGSRMARRLNDSNRSNLTKVAALIEHDQSVPIRKPHRIWARETQTRMRALHVSRLSQVPVIARC